MSVVEILDSRGWTLLHQHRQITSAYAAAASRNAPGWVCAGSATV
jgi:hypothetical protein